MDRIENHRIRFLDEAAPIRDQRLFRNIRRLRGLFPVEKPMRQYNVRERLFLIGMLRRVVVLEIRVHAEIAVRTDIVPQDLMNFRRIVFKSQLGQHIFHRAVVLFAVVHPGIDGIDRTADRLHGAFPAAAGLRNIQCIRKDILLFHGRIRQRTLQQFRHICA